MKFLQFLKRRRRRELKGPHFRSTKSGAKSGLLDVTTITAGDETCSTEESRDDLVAINQGPAWRPGMFLLRADAILRSNRI